MDVAERLKVARLAYIRAIALARAHPDPASWARVLAAARNLREAIADQRGVHCPDGDPAGA